MFSGLSESVLSVEFLELPYSYVIIQNAMTANLVAIHFNTVL